MMVADFFGKLAARRIFWEKMQTSGFRGHLQPSFNLIRHRGGGHIVPAADCFACCGSIKDFEKVKFSENS